MEFHAGRPYAAAVRRLQSSSGELTIREGKNLIHRQKVNLMYGAIFGADVDDVALWQEIATEVVDGLRRFPKSRGRPSIEHGVSHPIARLEIKPKGDDEFQKVMVRARMFLADSVIDRNQRKGILGADEVGTEGNAGQT
jgi:hypothetical protein